MVNHPKVFICHSSKDKYFVENFVKKLRYNGVDAWYDDYEIRLGDSIIEKINYGLKESQKGIIIFSNNLFKSKFATNEMNSIIFDYISNKEYSLIPVILDKDVEIPQLINHVSNVKINNIENYDNELNEICEMIFDKKQVLILNEPPSYSNLKQIPYCTKQDTEIFKNLGEYCLKNGFDEELDPLTILNICNYNEEEIEESLKILEENCYIKNEGSHYGMRFLSKKFTSKGFYYYITNYVEDSEKILKNIANSIYNNNQKEVKLISENNNAEISIVKGIIELFKENNYIECELNQNIISITPHGKRYFYNLLNN